MCLLTKPFDENSASVVIYQLTKTLVEIHNRNIAHLDIKENNILINNETSNLYKPECGLISAKFILTDFGIAKDITNSGVASRSFRSGTPKY